MAKKKKTTRKKSPSRNKKVEAPQHSLPDGFWRQSWAVGLIVISIFFVLAWFNAGGPVLAWLHEATLSTVGYSMYVIPLLFTYLAVEIFKAENNRLPFVTKFAVGLMVVWVAGLFGLLTNSEGETTGGFVGEVVNSGMLALVNSGVAAFIYVLLIIATTLFVLRVSPAAVVRWFGSLVRSENADETSNRAVMKRAAEATKPSTVGEIKLNAGVPTLDATEEDPKKTKRGVKSVSLKNSVQADKAAEDKAALVSVRDPNWQAPSLDLLEKKQSPANAGDVQQNAQIIKDTL